MRRSVVGPVVAAFVAAAVSAVVVGFLRTGRSTQTPRSDAFPGASSPGPSSPGAAAPSDKTKNADAQLTERLKILCSRASGDIGVAVIHVETGHMALVDSARQLPLYSVFKLPLAVAVLKNVEERQLVIEKKVRV